MSYSRLVNCMWRAGTFSGREFAAVTGERVKVVGEGEPDEGTQGVWLAAEIVVDGERRRGSVAIGEETTLPDGAVLRVVERGAAPVLGIDDVLVTQIECEVPPAVRECYDALRAGAESCACADKIVRMDQLRRTELFTSLLVDRLRRKTERIARFFERTGGDWNQTFHLLLFRSMGGDRNREVFTALASKATASIVSREKGSAFRVEALLLGAAGFLFAPTTGKDDYTLRLEDEAKHLLAKYSIVPLKPAEWSLSKLYPANHPAVRLAEIAALLCKRDFLLDGVLDCRTSEDIERLFAVEASEYWRTHYTPSGAVSAPSPKTIGRAKARLVGINLAAPLMFAYGRETGREELCERALDLLSTVPAEKNRLLDGWYDAGCTAQNGFESQALLELCGQYCAWGACADCRMGRAEIKKALAGTLQ